MNSYAQDKEDFFILDLFKKKRLKENYFFEFGAWDGIHLSNCRLLFENGWNGCFIEADKQRFSLLENNYKENDNILTLCEMIDFNSGNINHIIKQNNITSIEVLSIDVDGNDLSIWKSLKILKSKIVVIEFNQTIPFDTMFEDKTDKNIGSSYLAIMDYASSIGYELIHVTMTNLIFIEKKFNNNDFKKIGQKEVYTKLRPMRIGFNNFGEYLFFENDKLICKEVFKSPMSKSFITFQPIPKFLRKMTDVNGKGAKKLKQLYSLTVLLIMRPFLFFKYIINKIL